MKKKSAIHKVRRHHAPHFYVIFAVVAFFVGVFATFVFTKVVAQTNDAVYACAQKVSGNIRIVNPSESCKSNEYAMSWNKEGPAGPPGPSGSSTGLPYSCAGFCILGAYADKFAGKDFTGAQLFECNFVNADIHGVIFKNGNLDQCVFTNSNLSNADLSNIATENDNNMITAVDMKGTNLSGTNLSNNHFQNGQFQNANLQNANLSNTEFRYTNFSGAHNMSSANTSGTTWVGATCPDGTNSGDAGNTCVGHF